MASLTVHLPDAVKQQASKKAKHDGVTFTFIINQMLQAYLNNEIKFGLIKKEDENEVTVSFDVSTETGKKACLESFRKLAE